MCKTEQNPSLYERNVYYIKCTNDFTYNITYIMYWIALKLEKKKTLTFITFKEDYLFIDKIHIYI